MGMPATVPPSGREPWPVPAARGPVSAALARPRVGSAISRNSRPRARVPNGPPLWTSVDAHVGTAPAIVHDRQPPATDADRRYHQLAAGQRPLARRRVDYTAAPGPRPRRADRVDVDVTAQEAAPCPRQGHRRPLLGCAATDRHPG